MVGAFAGLVVGAIAVNVHLVVLAVFALALGEFWGLAAIVFVRLRNR